MPTAFTTSRWFSSVMPAAAGRTVPPGAASVLADDSEEAMDRDNDAFGMWCMAHGVECVRVLGISDFRVA